MDLEVYSKLTWAKGELQVREIIEGRDEVLKKFSPSFKPSAVADLDESNFRKFLSIKHNKHWTGLGRQPQLYADMKRLRQVLSVLVDESLPISGRVDSAIKAPGMGMAKLSAILLVTYPEKYGVWNGTSEKALRFLGLWPAFKRGTTTGERYVAVNEVLHDLARKLDIDLWTLDALWWGVKDEGTASKTSVEKDGVNDGESKAKALANMKNSILVTTRFANGQLENVTIKRKDLKMSDSELDALLARLLKKQEERCAITGLPFKYRGDKNMLPSADRIDSNGHYEAANLQLVCRFVNFWKQATPDHVFRRLIAVVRESSVS
ncbi:MULTISPECIES: hypothetical protein [Roseovarius]|uniref:hypothetical protein n=1 Tax=Roseovarius TaxID=74030 RepID=UPI00274027A0|nr:MULTISPECIES: hypothetical protein [unclassified Roseovarius]